MKFFVDTKTKNGQYTDSKYIFEEHNWSNTTTRANWVVLLLLCINYCDRFV